MSGYKQMLRDKMPEILDIALTYCKAKSRWIDYVYDNIIRKYSKDKRSTVVKIILGIKQKYKRQEIYDQLRYVEFKDVTREQVNNIPKSELYMKFSQTVLSTISEWVDWFSKSYFGIRDTYNHAKEWKMSDHEIKVILMDKYNVDGRLVNFLIKTF